MRYTVLTVVMLYSNGKMTEYANEKVDGRDLMDFEFRRHLFQEREQIISFGDNSA